MEPQSVLDQIEILAHDSNLARYEWLDRGRAPIGYIKGMAFAYYRIYTEWKAGSSNAKVIAGAVNMANSNDALALYTNKFRARGWSNTVSSADTLRNTFNLLIGLGMRESSGQYCCGRDTSAKNVQSDTAEAGMFQMSWDIRNGSPLIGLLPIKYQSSMDDGLLTVFKEGVKPKPADLQIWGTGDGAKFQMLCKSKPMFSVEAALIGLRTNRTHWGPINRQQAEIRPEADELLRQVQVIADRHAPSSGAIPVVVGGGIGTVTATALHWAGVSMEVLIPIAVTVMLITAVLFFRKKE